jgi:hypothetical protein
MTSKRIHITFLHDGMIAQVPIIGSRKLDIEAFLLAVWSEFGPVISAKYHREYAYCVVTYQTHKDAIFALAGLEDPIQVQAAVQQAIGSDPTRAALTKQLFMEDSHGMTITAAWADA